MTITSDKIYRGVRLSTGECSVRVDSGDMSKELPPHTELRNHSPTGFEWGYGGSGPAQLALAILLEEYRDPEYALKHYQALKRRVVARLWGAGWVLTSQDIRAELFAIERE